LWGSGDTIKPAEIFVVEIAVPFPSVIASSLFRIKDRLPLSILSRDVEFPRFVRPVSVFIATIPMMVTALVYDARYLTESGSTRFVKRRLLDGRIIFKEHFFHNRAFEATIF